MANVKITELSAIANPASTDVLAIVDVTADITKKVTIADLLENAGDGTAAAPAFSFNSDTNTGVFLEAADKLGLSTNGTGRIYIDGSGNVGIAKSNPTQTLDVNGTAAVSGALTQGGNNVVTVGDTGTVTSTMIADGTIVNADVSASAAIGLSKLATGALPTGITVASANIVDGTIVNADVSATAEIAVSKLANGTARQLLQTDAAGTGVEFTSNVDVPGTLDVTGVATFDSNVTVGGNLTVNGTTATIDSTTLVVEDRNIEMGAVTTPSDTTADGGGITLKGATDKTLTWVNSTDCWTFNQALNLTAGTESVPALVFDADVNTGIFHPAADTIAVSTQGNERLRVTADGKINLNESAGAVGSKLNIFNGSDADNIIGITGADESSEYAGIGVNGGNAVITGGGAGTTNTGIVFKTAESGTETGRLFITSAGKTGIGTSSPASLLTVSSGSASFTPIAGADELFLESDASCGMTIGCGSNQKGNIYFGESGVGTSRGAIIYDTNSDYFAFSTAGLVNERMRIDSSGNVGIGTSSPSEKLEVTGNLQLDAANAGLKIKAGATGNRGAVDFTLNTDSTVYGSLELDYDNRSTDGLKLKSDSYPITIEYDTGDYFRVKDSSAERMRIDSSGNVGIGSTSPIAQLTARGINSGGQGGTMCIQNTASGLNTNVALFLTPNNGGGNDLERSAIIKSRQSSAGNYANLEFYTSHSDTPTERMRIHSNGNVTFSSGSNINPVVSDTLGIALRTAGNFLTNTTSTNAPHQFRRNTDGDLIRFHMNSTSSVGDIRVSSTDCFFENNSDYRLKENVVSLEGAIDRVKQLTPKRFNFIADPDTTVDGFLAHEAQTVVPQAVSGTHNEVDEENNPVMQRIDQSKMVPLLTAALKEAIAKIETLETKVAALEAQ